MKGGSLVYKRVFLLLIGWFAFQVAGVSFGASQPNQPGLFNQHSVVKSIATHSVLPDVQFLEAGEEESKYDVLLCQEVAAFILVFITTPYCETIGFQSVSPNPVGVHLPLYLLHHCLRIPPPNQA
jgi:hypothetical protein